MGAGERAAALQPSDFGTLLKRYRAAANLTQEELAELAGLSVRGISDLERGIAVRPQRETLASLLRALQISPGEQARLEAAAVHRRPVATPAPPAAHGVPHTPPLVGRSRELELIERHLAGETPPVLVLAGEPGIGKSRLLWEGARLAEGQGWTVLLGGAQRRTGQQPYAPMLDTLSHSLPGLSASRLRAALSGCGWLTRLLPELTETVSAPMPVGALTPEQERRLVFAAVARFLSNLAGPAGTLLVLDDLQWSGLDGLDLIASLIESDLGPPIRLLGAYRDTEVGVDHPLTTVLAELGERRLVKHVSVAPLDADDAMAMLDGLLPTSETVVDRVRQQLVRRTGGVPFFLVSCAYWLEGEGNREAGQESLPWNVGQSIRQRMAALPKEAQEVLQAAAVVGRVVDRLTLSAMLDAPEWQILSGLEVACRGRLLLHQARGTYRFAHDIVRESIVADMGEGARILLHRNVAEVLEKLPEQERKARAPELAWHFMEGDEPQRALPHAVKAGDEARILLAYEEAEGHYRLAVRLAHEVADPAEEAKSLEKLGILHWTLGRYDEAVTSLERAAQLYEAQSDLDAVGRLAGKIGWAHSHRGTVEEGTAQLEAIATRLEEAGAHEGLVAIYDALVHLCLQQDKRDQLALLAERAADAASAVEDERIRISGELNRGLALMWQDRPDAALPVLERVMSRAKEVGEADIHFRALHWTALLYVGGRDLHRARVYMERAVEVTERAVSPNFHTTALTSLASLLFVLGDWAGAREYGERAVAVEPDARSWAAGDAHVGLAQLALAEGRVEDASLHLRRGLLISERTSSRRLSRVVQRLLAERDLVEGQVEGALRRLELLESSSRLDWRECRVLAEARRQSGDAARAAAIVEKHVREARASGSHGLLPLTDWLHLHGALLAGYSRWAEASAAFDEGLELAQHFPYPYGAGRTLYEMGLTHAARGECSEARIRLEEALCIFDWLGARPYAEQTRRALGRLPDENIKPAAGS